MKKAIKYISFGLFVLSLLYYVFWIGYAVYCAFVGIDSGWAMPAMSNHELDYGFDAFVSAIAIGILYTLELYWFVPLYQLVYLIVIGIKKITRKTNRL